MDTAETPTSVRISAIPGTGLMRMINAHRLLWGAYFSEAWKSTPLDAKFAWIFAINNTVAIITLLEIFVLKKA